jgi:hypothetical protein
MMRTGIPFAKLSQKEFALKMNSAPCEPCLICFVWQYIVDKLLGIFSAISKRHFESSQLFFCRPSPYLSGEFRRMFHSVHFHPSDQFHHFRDYIHNHHHGKSNFTTAFASTTAKSECHPA